MIQRRRARLVLLALAASVATAGCATFDENGLVVRAGDRELTADEFEALAAGVGAEGGSDRATRDQVDQILTLFVADALVRADLDQLGVDVTDADVPADATAFDRLGAESQAAFQTYVGLPADELLDDAVRATYAAGPDATGLICSAHILVETEAEAREVIAEVRGGAAFADVAAERSTDPGSGANGGQLGCSNLGEFEQTYIPEFVEAALDAEIGEMTDPVESQFGFHVIRLVPLDELAPEEAAAIVPIVRFAGLAERYDVSVDPRYGEWSVRQLRPVS